MIKSSLETSAYIYRVFVLWPEDQRVLGRLEGLG